MNTDEPTERPLQSWKEIAAYLERDVRTATRWEKENGLPVRRHGDSKGSSVYAYPSEIEAWRAGRQPMQPETAAALDLPISPRWIWGAVAAAAVAGLLLAGPIFNPPNPLADAAAGSGAMIARQVWTGDGVDDAGGISPDGRYLAFVEWGCGDLMLRDLESGKNNRLHDAECYKNGYVIQARFSPDGKRIAYLWEDYADPDDRHWEVRLLDLGPDMRPGQTKKLLDNGQYGIADWSHDGSKLLVNVGHNDSIRISLVSVETGEIQPLKTLDWDDPDPYLSPDGRFIAYDLPEERGGVERDIHLLATDGSFETTLIEHPANDRVIAWDPDGSRLFFLSDREGQANLYALPLENGRATGLPIIVKHAVGEAKPLGVTADGRLFYGTPVSRPKVSFADLSRIGDAGYSPEPLRTSIRGAQTSPAFSPDGRLMAYIAEGSRSAASGPAPTQLVVRDLKTGVERAFGQGVTGLRVAGGFAAIVFSPDSRRVLTLGYDPAKSNRRIVATIDAETGTVQTIRIQGEDDHMYPSGWIDDRIVLVRNQTPREENGKRNVRSVLMALDVESGDARDVYMRGRLSWSGSLTPNRREVVFLEGLQGQNGNGTLQLSVIPLHGGEPRGLISFERQDEPIHSVTVSPDGETVYFSKRGRELWKVPFAGGESKPLDLRLVDGNVREMSIHPDGRRIAFQSGERRVEIWALENFLGAPTD